METEQAAGSAPDKAMGRRYFLEMVGGGALLLTIAGGIVRIAQYLSPNVLHEPPLRFKAGTIEDYPADSVTLIVDQKVYIVRAKEGYLYAMSAVCTHLGCITAWDSTQGLVACPCHGSRFDRDGNVIGGPAPRPLQRYALSMNEQGLLFVDKGKVVGEDAILRV